MNEIEIPEYRVANLDNVVPGVTGLRILFVNVFALSSSSGDWALVDAGLYLSAGRIRRWAEDHFGELRPRFILLTHGHFDHIGALKDLAEHWDVTVYVHSAEIPFVTGKQSYPPPDPRVGGGLMSAISPF